MHGRGNGAWFPMALSCGSLPALIETSPLGQDFMRVFILSNSLSGIHRRSIRDKFGLSCI